MSISKIRENQVTALIGPSGCGKSTFLRCLNRMNDTISDRQGDRQDHARRRGHLRSAASTWWNCAPASAWCSRSPTRSRSRSTTTSPTARASTALPRARPISTGIVESSLKKAALWNEVKDRLHEAGTGLSGGQQQRLCIARAIAVSPGSHPDGRAVLGARPDRHRQGRGADRRAAAELHHRHRHPLDAAGGARLAAHGDVPSRLPRRGRRRPTRCSPTPTTSARRTTSPAGSAERLPVHAADHEDQIMGEHTVTSFDEDLEHIQRLIRDMGDLAGAMVGASIRALLASDNALAQRVVSDDAIMDAKQRELDDRAITLIAKRQPMAQDLRAVVGAIRMAGDLERIGDLAKNIAKRVSAVGQSADAAQALARHRSDGGAGARPGPRRGRAYVARDADALRDAAHRRREDRHQIHGRVPRAADLHDGGSAQHHRLHASPVLREEPRAHRRPCHQHRRKRLLCDHRRSNCRRTGRSSTRPRWRFWPNSEPARDIER